MKYLSVLLFAIALAWTWNIINSQASIGSQTHAGIQSAMAQLVQTTVLNKRPQARDFLIQKMRTEEREGGEVRVYFQYAFNEPDVQGKLVASQISGIATLVRSDATAPEGTERWQLKKVQTTNDVISFERGMVISPGMDTEAEEPVSETQGEAPAAPVPAPEAPAPSTVPVQNTTPPAVETKGPPAVLTPQQNGTVDQR